ncbi:hypothetical protein AZE42_05507 [Rhizopogon vesiculosus]|uniref:SH3 domain-containing protein n=1 Tax=Rhizopogon vesiculosus TaxID=180088 RepID=A0A1J8Q467_9AGAM|nr:hypothetical protein AZE42_05507 [Rhizopogon vesiculosus]
MSDLTLLDHIISQTRQNVDLLMSHNRISQSDGRDILAKLPSQGMGSIVSLTQQTQRLRMSPVPAQSLKNHSSNPGMSSKAEARAKWEWTSEDPNDVSFHAGEIIEIVKETNADWWTGRNKAGKEGLFPSVYVEKLPPRSVSPLSFSEFPNSRTSLDSKYGLTEPKYSTPPGPPQYSSPQSLQPHYPPPSGPPAGGYMPPPSGPTYDNSYSGNPPVAQPIPQQPPKKGRFGGLGTMMAQSAAGGLGFGAGAAIGSDVINSIF